MTDPDQIENTSTDGAASHGQSNVASMPTGDGRALLAGCTMGSALLMYGIFFDLAPDVRNLIVCVGLGVIVAALGSQATLKYRAATVTGGAAIAILLYWQIERPVSHTLGFLRIHASDADDMTVYIEDHRRLMSRKKTQEEYTDFEFVIIRDRLIRSSLTVALDSTDAFVVMEIPADYINEHLSQRSTIELRYETDSAGRIIDFNNNTVSTYTRISEKAVDEGGRP